MATPPHFTSSSLLCNFHPKIRQWLRNEEYQSLDHFYAVCSELKEYLSHIELPIDKAAGVGQALKDMARESVMINGTIWDGEVCAQVLVAALEEVIGKNNDTMQVAMSVICAASRTTSSDAYFVTEDLFGGPNLLIKPPSGPHPTPIKIEVGEEGIEVTSTNDYCIFHRQDIELNLDGATPLATLRTVLVDSLLFLPDSSSGSSSSSSSRGATTNSEDGQQQGGTTGQGGGQRGRKRILSISPVIGQPSRRNSRASSVSGGDR